MSSPPENTKPSLHSSTQFPRVQEASAKWRIFCDGTSVKPATIRKHRMARTAPMMYRTQTKEYEIRNMINDTKYDGLLCVCPHTGSMYVQFNRNSDIHSRLLSEQIASIYLINIMFYIKTAIMFHSKYIKVAILKNKIIVKDSYTPGCTL